MVKVVSYTAALWSENRSCDIFSLLCVLLPSRPSCSTYNGTFWFFIIFAASPHSCWSHQRLNTTDVQHLLILSTHCIHLTPLPLTKTSWSLLMHFDFVKQTKIKNKGYTPVFTRRLLNSLCSSALE